jgi:hypothetical protein
MVSISLLGSLSSWGFVLVGWRELWRRRGRERGRAAPRGRSGLERKVSRFRSRYETRSILLTAVHKSLSSACPSSNQPTTSSTSSPTSRLLPFLHTPPKQLFIHQALSLAIDSPHKGLFSQTLLALEAYISLASPSRADIDLEPLVKRCPELPLLSKASSLSPPSRSRHSTACLQQYWPICWRRSWTDICPQRERSSSLSLSSPPFALPRSTRPSSFFDRSSLATTHLASTSSPSLSAMSPSNRRFSSSTSSTSSPTTPPSTPTFLDQEPISVSFLPPTPSLDAPTSHPTRLLLSINLSSLPPRIDLPSRSLPTSPSVRLGAFSLITDKSNSGAVMWIYIGLLCLADVEM